MNTLRIAHTIDNRGGYRIGAFFQLNACYALAEQLVDIVIRYSERAVFAQYAVGVYVYLYYLIDLRRA